MASRMISETLLSVDLVNLSSILFSWSLILKEITFWSGDTVFLGFLDSLSRCFLL